MIWNRHYRVREKVSGEISIRCLDEEYSLRYHHDQVRFFSSTSHTFWTHPLVLSSAVASINQLFNAIIVSIESSIANTTTSLYFSNLSLATDRPSIAPEKSPKFQYILGDE